MLIAQQKRKENIAEYILYLYQIEDIIRAFKFDINLIKDKLVTTYRANEETSSQISNWYENLVLMMEKERIQEKGHLQFLINLIEDLNEFHLKLISDNSEKVYIETFKAVSGLITELKQKNNSASNDIQIGLDTIYGFLLLKMKKTEISEATSTAVKQLSHWMRILSKLYREFEIGKLDLN